MFYDPGRNHKNMFLVAGQSLQDSLRSTLHPGLKAFPLEESS